MIGTYLFHIGSFGVPTMGVCVLVGAILAVFISWLLRKKSALDWNGEVVDAIILAVLLGFVGMKILYWIVTPGLFKTAFAHGFFSGIWSLLTEGMVWGFKQMVEATTANVINTRLLKNDRDVYRTLNEMEKRTNRYERILGIQACKEICA